MADNGDGTRTITCPDGSAVTLSDGQSATGAVPLIRIEEEPSGNNCAMGGHRVDVGLDLDGDGALADEEVTSTDYACAPPVIRGDVQANSQEQLDQIRGVERIIGSLTLSGDITDLCAWRQRGADRLRVLRRQHLDGQLRRLET